MAVMRLIVTPADPLGLVCRLALGVVMFAHGAQELLGWFGGPGLRGEVGQLVQLAHVPAALAALSVFAEFLGALGLIVGLLGRVAALAIFANMVVAIATVHWPVGFFMNWMGKLEGEGYEYHLLAIGLAIAVMIRGSGAISLDRLLTLMWKPKA